LCSALNASISDDRFLSKNSPTLMATSYMARFMTFVYTKLFRANRTYFSYFIHGDILS
jgi:hypothetical protein